MGIEETKKLVNAIKNGSLELLNIDFTLVLEELKDTDSSEAAELFIEIGKAAIEILAKVRLSPISGPVFSLLLKKI